MKTVVVTALAMFLVIGLITTVVYWPRSDSNDEPSKGEWTCSMHPQIRRSGPGRCPICGMDLVPVAQLSSEQSRLDQRAGIETALITHRELFKEIRTVGKLDYNERQLAYITARVNGRVEKVYADFVGMEVRKDTHLLKLLSPDLLISFQALLMSVQDGDKAGAENARVRLRTLGMLDAQIEDIERTKKIEPYLTMHAPMGGTIIEKGVRVGQYVKEGDLLYRIANLDPIWFYFDIYEFDLGWLLPGQAAEVTVEAFRGETFAGKVTFIDPFLDEKTRTVKARINLPNPAKKLRPGMYASVSVQVKLRSDGTPEPTGLEGKFFCFMHPEVVRDEPDNCSICDMPLERAPERKPPVVSREHHDHEHHAQETTKATTEPGKVLAIPAGAALDTGRRKIAYRQTKEGAYELVELRLGPRAEGKDEAGQRASYYPVLSGLAVGDRVVVRGGFLNASTTCSAFSCRRRAAPRCRSARWRTSSTASGRRNSRARTACWSVT